MMAIYLRSSRALEPANMSSLKYSNTSLEDNVKFMQITSRELFQVWLLINISSFTVFKVVDRPIHGGLFECNINS